MFGLDAGGMYILLMGIGVLIMAAIFVKFGVNIGLMFLMSVYFLASLLAGDVSAFVIPLLLALVLLWDRYFDDDKGKSYFERGLNK